MATLAQIQTPSSPPSPLTFASFSPSSQLALPDHPPISPFLDPRSPLISRSPKEPYPSLHRVSGMTCHLNSAPFFTSTIVTPKHKTSSSSCSSVCHPQGFPLETEVPPLQTLFPDSPDSISSHSSPKLHPP